MFAMQSMSTNTLLPSEKRRGSAVPSLVDLSVDLSEKCLNSAPVEVCGFDTCPEKIAVPRPAETGEPSENSEGVSSVTTIPEDGKETSDGRERPPSAPESFHPQEILEISSDENANSLLSETCIVRSLEDPKHNNNNNDDDDNHRQVNNKNYNSKETNMNEVNRILNLLKERLETEGDSTEDLGDQIRQTSEIEHFECPGVLAVRKQATNPSNVSARNLQTSEVRQNSGSSTLKNERNQPALQESSKAARDVKDGLEESDEEELEKTFVEGDESEEAGFENDTSEIDGDASVIGQDIPFDTTLQPSDVSESASVKEALNFLDENINFFATGSVINSSLESSGLTGSVSSVEQKQDSQRDEIFYDNFNEAFYSEDDLRSEDAFSDDANNNVDGTRHISNNNNNSSRLQLLDNNSSPFMKCLPDTGKMPDPSKASPKFLGAHRQEGELNEISLTFLKEVVKSTSRDFEPDDTIGQAEKALDPIGQVKRDSNTIGQIDKPPDSMESLPEEASRDPKVQKFKEVGRMPWEGRCLHARHQINWLVSPGMFPVGLLVSGHRLQIQCFVDLVLDSV